MASEGANRSAVGGSVAASGGGGSSAEGGDWAKVTGVVYWDQAIEAKATGRRHYQDNVGMPVDDPCHYQYQNTRRRSVTDLEEANFNLSCKIDALELEIKTVKAKKKIMKKRHLEEMKSRDRKDVAFVVIVASCVVMYFFFALMIRGFV